MHSIPYFSYNILIAFNLSREGGGEVPFKLAFNNGIALLWYAKKKTR